MAAYSERSNAVLRRPAQGNLGHGLGLSILLFLIASAGCVTTPERMGESLAASSTAVDEWVEYELGPYLAEQLSTHPRFKHQPFLLVRMSGADVQPDIDEFTAAIRDRLMDRLLSTPGVHPVWRPSVAPPDHHRSLADVQCGKRGQVPYFIGIETRLLGDGNLKVAVRALDVTEGAWVTGFGKIWMGRPTRWQRSVLGRPRADEYLRGLRALPFHDGQSDLAAAYLARNLSCLLRELGSDDVVVYAEPNPDRAPFFVTTMDLVGNYLSRFREVRVTDNADDANYVIQGEVHQIHADLHQLWVIVRSRKNGEYLAGGDAEAYVRLQYAAPQPQTDHGPSALSSQAQPSRDSAPGIFGDFRLLSPINQHLCGSVDPWLGGNRIVAAGDPLPANGCFGLELELGREADVFLLNYDTDGALVRLLPSSCSPSAQHPTRLALGDVLRFPSRRDRLEPAFMVNDEPGEETFYAIAATEPAVAGSIARHLGRLFDRCGGNRGPELRRLDMDRWLSELDRILLSHASAVDWRAVRVRHIR